MRGIDSRNMYFGRNTWNVYEKVHSSERQQLIANNQNKAKRKGKFSFLDSLELLDLFPWLWPIGTRRLQRQSVCVVWIPSEPNSPLVTTGLTGSQNQPKSFLFSAPAASSLCWGRICHGWLLQWQCYQVLLHLEASSDPNIQKSISHTQIAQWHISSRRRDFYFPREPRCTREMWEWRALCGLSSSGTQSC